MELYASRGPFARSPMRAARVLSLLTLAVAIWMSAQACAQLEETSSAPARSWLETCETALFRQTYAQESLESRYARLERQAFGQAMDSEPTSARGSRLKRALNHLTAPQTSAPVKTDARAPRSEAGRAASPTAPGSPPSSGAPETADYPSVTAMEYALFRQEFRSEDIASRLARLERRVFNLTYPQLPLADRVDQLTRKIPQALLGSDASASEFSPPPSRPPSPGQLAYFRAVEDAEMTVLGRSNPQGLLTERLEMMEWRLFGRPYEGESPDTRFSRIQARLGAVRLSSSFGQQPSPPSSWEWTTTPMTETTTQWTVPAGQSATMQSQRVWQTPTGVSRVETRQQVTAGGAGAVVYTETRTSPAPPLPFSSSQARRFRRRPPVGAEPQYLLPPLLGPQASVARPTTSAKGANASSGTASRTSSVRRLSHAERLAQRRLKGLRLLPATVVPASPDAHTQAVLQEYTALSAPLSISPLASPAAASDARQVTIAPSWARQLDRIERQATGALRTDLPMEGRLSLLESRLLGETFDAFSPPARVFNLQRRYFRNPLKRLALSLTAEPTEPTSGKVALPPLVEPLAGASSW